MKNSTRSIAVNVRLSREEATYLDHLMAEVGHNTRSGMIRELIRTYAVGSISREVASSVRSAIGEERVIP